MEIWNNVRDPESLISSLEIGFYLHNNQMGDEGLTRVTSAIQ